MEMITYKRSDGGLIYGEFLFVTETDGWFDDYDERIELVKETWQLVKTETILIPEEWCEECNSRYCDGDHEEVTSE